MAIWKNSLEIRNIQAKGPCFNAMEKCHIYRTKQTGFLLNDIHADTYNPIFELLIARTSPGFGPPDH
jgi:hypothetical protein